LAAVLNGLPASCEKRKRKNNLLTSGTYLGEWFAVLNGLLAIGVSFVSVIASTASVALFFLQDRSAELLRVCVWWRQKRETTGCKRVSVSIDMM